MSQSKLCFFIFATMSTQPTRPTESPPASFQTGLIASLVDQIIRAVGEANEPTALERVAKLRAAQPGASPELLVQQLTKQKCLQAGAVGAITAGMTVIPGVGTLVTFTFGVTADLGLTLKMQAELVLEIAAVYERHLQRFERRQAIIFLLGMGIAADQLLNKAGGVIAQKASERLAQKSMEKALPVIGVAASAGKNILTTYLVGQRAQVYFSQGPEAVGDWSDSLKTLTGVDGQKIIGWLVEATERSWRLLTENGQQITVATITAGQSAGQVVIQWGGQAGSKVVTVSREVVAGARRSTTTVMASSQRLGQEAIISANIAGRIAAETGRGAATMATAPAMAATQKLSALLSRQKQSQTRSKTMYDITEIPNIPNQGERIEEITVDCYNQSEELSAFEVYFDEAMEFPFAATWRDPDEPDHAEPVTVLGLAEVDERRGVLLQVQRGEKQRRLLAEQLWADDADSANAIILNDYRYWVNELNGLTPGFG